MVYLLEVARGVLLFVRVQAIHDPRGRRGCSHPRGQAGGATSGIRTHGATALQHLSHPHSLRNVEPSTHDSQFRGPLANRV